MIPQSLLLGYDPHHQSFPLLVSQAKAEIPRVSEIRLEIKIVFTFRSVVTVLLWIKKESRELQA